MSMCYEMQITVRGVAESFQDAVMDACAEVWDFRTEHFKVSPFEPGVLHARALGRLNAGARVQDMCEQMAVVIWRAVGHYCFVAVRMTCLDDGCAFDESQYGRLMKGASDAPESSP